MCFTGHTSARSTQMNRGDMSDNIFLDLGKKNYLKGTLTLMITMFYMKDLNKTMNFDTSFI